MAVDGRELRGRAQRVPRWGPSGGGAPEVGNGAMIAWLGLLKLRAQGAMAIEETGVRPYERTDAVEVTWR